jgi:hypothetical protein
MENRQEQRFRRSRRGSLFFPILLIAIGIVVLLSNLELFTGDAWVMAGAVDRYRPG